MLLRIVRLSVCLTLIVSTCTVASAEDPPKKPVASGASNLFGLGEMATTAADLRAAGEAFERFGESLGGITGTIAESLAKMSSGFDPFGYQSAFRTIGQQTEIIHEQEAVIRELLEREISRLQQENEALKRQLLRKRRPRREP